MRVLVGGYFSKKSGKTTFCRTLFKTLNDQAVSTIYYKPISGIHCWHDFEFVKKTALQGNFVSEDAVNVYGTIFNSFSEVISRAWMTNHTHVLFSRLDLSDSSAVELLLRHDDVFELERELGAVIDSIPLLARYGNKILVNQWWWEHSHVVILGKELREIISSHASSASITFVDPKIISGFLFWDPRDFINQVNSEQSKYQVQIIELHDDDILSGLADLNFDYFVLVAGQAAFLTSHEEWLKVITPIKDLALSYPASKLFPRIKWIFKGKKGEIIQNLLDFLR